MGTGGRRWRAIIIVIIPIKKLIIGPGSPPADPIMGWFSSQPFIPPSLHSFTTEVRLQILSSHLILQLSKQWLDLDSVLPAAAYENTPVCET